MSTSTLDPVIHHPERLRIAATLVALPPGDSLTVTRGRVFAAAKPAPVGATQSQAFLAWTGRAPAWPAGA